MVKICVDTVPTEKTRGTVENDLFSKIFNGKTMGGVWFVVMCPWCDTHYDDVILMFFLFILFFITLPQSKITNISHYINFITFLNNVILYSILYWDYIIVKLQSYNITVQCNITNQTAPQSKVKLHSTKSHKPHS